MRQRRRTDTSHHDAVPPAPGLDITAAHRPSRLLTPHRLDFFYTPAGKILVNEINTMPGMTPASGFPMMWAATGLPLPQLVDRIIQTALRKRLPRP